MQGVLTVIVWALAVCLPSLIQWVVVDIQIKRERAEYKKRGWL